MIRYCFISEWLAINCSTHTFVLGRINNWSTIWHCNIYRMCAMCVCCFSSLNRYCWVITGPGFPHWSEGAHPRCVLLRFVQPELWNRYGPEVSSRASQGSRTPNHKSPTYQLAPPPPLEDLEWPSPHPSLWLRRWLHRLNNVGQYKEYNALVYREFMHTGCEQWELMLVLLFRKK